MQPRSRIRGRDPPSGGGGGGRYRRRSPPPPPPRHQRRPRDPPPPPPQLQRRSPDRLLPPRRYQENPLPDTSAAGDRRSRADILLEAGRLAAHYLVAQGVLPEHVLRAREEPNHNPAPGPEPLAPAPVSYRRKRDDDDDPRWRRNAGDWGRGKGEDDRQARRSGWDRRSHSFDGRRKYNDGGGGGGDVDRGGRRTRDYDEPKRPPMSRSYSHNDRRASGDGRVDRRRRSSSRSRSRSRTRTRSYYDGTRRDSDWRAGSRDLDHTKVPDSAIIPAAAGDGDAHCGDADEMPRQPRVPSSVVVAEVTDAAGQAMAIEDGEMDSEIVGLDHAQDISEDEDGEFAEDISEDEDGEFAVADLNDEDGGEMDVTQPQLSDVDVHLSESVEEPVHMQSQLNNVVEEMEAGTGPMDACMIEPLGEDNGGSEVREEMEAPRSELETAVGDVNRDEQELPAWYKIFDLNVIETPEGCEMAEISGNPPADHVYDSVPDLAGQTNQQTNYDASEIQGQDEHAGEKRLMEDEHDLSKYDLNNEADEHAQDGTSEIQGRDEHERDDHLLKNGHDLNMYDLNNEADKHAQENHLLSDEKILLNPDLDNCHRSNEQALLKENADKQEHDIHQIRNEQNLVSQGTAEQDLESHHVKDAQLMLNHGADEHPDDNHQMELEPMLLPVDVHDSDSYNLNNEQMLLNNGADKHAADICQLKDGQMLLDQAADGQSRVHNIGNGRTIPVINLEDDNEEQPDTREFLESKSGILHEYTDNVLQECMSSQDQHTSSFPDNIQTNIEAASSLSVTPNFGNRCTGRGAVSAQGIPHDDDVLYGAFDKLPLEVINVWDAPSSEVGKSL